MPSQGPNSPGTVTTQNSLFGGTEDWVNPSNVTSSNDSRAVASLAASEMSYELWMTNFGFSIPAGATINGIEVAVEKRTGGGSVRDEFLALIVGGLAWDEDHADGTSWDVADATTTYGSPTDDMSAVAPPTVAQINASDFGVYLGAKEVTGVFPGVAEVDHVTITVHYTEAGASSPRNLPLLGVG